MLVKYGMRIPTQTHTPEDIAEYVGSGWRVIVIRLCNDLHKLGWDGELLQIKEKFGSLRFYIGQGTDEIFKRIDQAEAESCKTCMTCGQPGRIMARRGWLRAVCPVCAGDDCVEADSELC